MSWLINQNAALVTVKAALIEYLLSSLGGSGTQRCKHLTPYKVVMANVLAKSCLFTHPADTQEHYHATHVCVHLMNVIWSIFIKRNDKFRLNQLQSGCLYASVNFTCFMLFLFIIKTALQCQTGYCWAKCSRLFITRDLRQATSGIFYSKYHNLVYKSLFLVTSSGLTSHRSAVMYSLSQNKVNLFFWFIQKDLTSVDKSAKFFLRLALDIRSNIILLYGGHFMTFTHSDKCQTQFERYFIISTIHAWPTASILTCSC